MASDRRPTSGAPRRGPARPASRPPVDREQAAEDVRRFAELVKAQQAKTRKDQADARQRAADEKRRVDDAAAAERRAGDAQSAKDGAARRLRDVRARGTAAQVAEAEEAYKAALAEQITVEQGERPSWAPAPPVVEPDTVSDEPTADEGAAGAPATDEPTTDEPTTDEGAAGDRPAGDDLAHDVPTSVANITNE